MSLLLLFRPPSVSGTAALAVKEPVVAAVGAETFSGTVAVTVAEPTIAASGKLIFSGTAAASLTLPTIASAGAETFSGTAALRTEEPSISAAAAETFTGTAAIRTQEPVLAANAAETFSGSAGLRTEQPVIAATAKLTFSGTAALSVTHPAIAANGAEAFTGSGALRTEEPVIGASGTETFSASAALRVEEPSVSATAALTFTGDAALSVHEPVLAASGTYTPLAITGSAALAVSEPAIAGVETETFSGSAALALTEPRIGAMATLIFSGSVALTAGEPTIGSSGAQTFVGSGASAVSRPAIVSSGGETLSGGAAVALPEPTIAGSGGEVFSGSVSAAVRTPAITSAGTYTPQPITGTAALLVEEPTLAGAGTLTFSGSTALDTEDPTVITAGAETFTATGALRVEEPVVGAAGTYTPLAITGAVALSAAEPSIGATASQLFVAGCADYGSAVYGQSTFGCTGNTNLTVPTPTIGASGLTAAFIGTVALSVPEPTIAATGSEIFVAGCAEYGTAVYGQNSYGCTGNTNLNVPEPAVGGTGLVTLPPSAALPKAGGKGSRPRPLLTRYRRETDPRFISATLLAPQPRVQAELHAESTPRRLSSILRGPRPSLRATGSATHARLLRATLAAPQPRLQARGRYLPTAHVTATVYASAPHLQAGLVHTPDESWLLTLMLADSFTGMVPNIRSVDVRGCDGDETLLVAALLAQNAGAYDDLHDEATKRLSNLQRESNAQVARTDRQQHRIVQAALPHLRHAFSAQRDAILVALPHAAKASVDPDYVLNDQGFLSAVALLIQAIEDLQQTGVMLGYTDAAPPDSFDLSSPYIDAAITQLATRVTGITDTTAQAIRDVIAQGLSEGWSVAEMGSAIQDLGAFSESRALTISMTESRVALNTGNAAAWQDMGVDEVLIADGDYDEVCAELDGTTQLLSWYIENPISHPNCRRTATAIPAAVPA